MKKKISFTLIILFSLGLIYLIYSYNRYLVEIKEVHQNLIDTYKSFSINFKGYYPSSREDVNLAFNWKQHVSGTNYKNDFLTKYGFDVLNDSVSENATIYSYGKDNIDNKLSNNELINYDKFINEYSFIDFIFRKNIDVPFLTIKKNKIDCERIFDSLDQEPFKNYKLFNNLEYIWSNKKYRRKFLDLLTILEKSILNYDINNYSGRDVLVIYKNKNVSIYCDSFIDKKKKKFLIDQVKTLMNENDDFFDYAVFTLRVPKSMIYK